MGGHTLTERFEELKVRLDCLKETFQVVSDENGDINRTDADKIKALRLLVHAELESYIEELAKKIFDEGVTKWQEEKIGTFQICSLFIWHAAIETKEDSNTKAHQIFHKYRENVLRNNNGIKEENLKKLFNPLGYKIESFSAEFLANLDTYGAERGQVAHSSASAIQTQLDYQTEVDKINDLVNGLEEFQSNLTF